MNKMPKLKNERKAKRWASGRRSAVQYRLQVVRCNSVIDGVKFEFNDIISMTKYIGMSATIRNIVR